MRKYFRYLNYLIRHKWFVLIAGLKIGVPVYRLIIHDWSKFLPSEWFPYMNYFYENKYVPIKKSEWINKSNYNGSSKKEIEKQFKMAWLLHQRRNKHHWQYWCLRNDSGSTDYIQMPFKYMLEMVADWAGAGRAITGKWEVKSWYKKNKEKIKLYPTTRFAVECYIDLI